MAKAPPVCGRVLRPDSRAPGETGLSDPAPGLHLAPQGPLSLRELPQEARQEGCPAPFSRFSNLTLPSSSTLANPFPRGSAALLLWGWVRTQDGGLQALADLRLQLSSCRPTLGEALRVLLLWQRQQTTLPPWMHLFRGTVTNGRCKPAGRVRASGTGRLPPWAAAPGRQERDGLWRKFGGRCHTCCVHVGSCLIQGQLWRPPGDSVGAPPQATRRLLAELRQPPGATGLFRGFCSLKPPCPFCLLPPP